jgi:hypothetical protein
VALEYPILAILASILFVTVVFSSLYLYLYVVSEVSRIPVVGGFAEVGLADSTWEISVTVRHERGEPVSLQRVVLVTEGGTVERSPTEVELRGFSGTTLLPGSVGVVRISLPYTELVHGKMYSGILIFDKGTLVFTYTTPP